jgi:prevent-host-death family protein
MLHMRSIGIRELRQNASKYIRMVKAGETIEVRERDVPVARLTPIPPPRKLTLEELIERGVVRPAERPFRPVKRLPPTDGPTSTEILSEMRDDRI